MHWPFFSIPSQLGRIVRRFRYIQFRGVEFEKFFLVVVHSLLRFFVFSFRCPESP